MARIQDVAMQTLYEKVVFREGFNIYNKWFDERGFNTQQTRLIRFGPCAMEKIDDESVPRFVVSCGGVGKLRQVDFLIVVSTEGGYNLSCRKDLAPVEYHVVTRYFNEQLKHFRKTLRLNGVQRQATLPEVLDWTLSYFRKEWNSGMLMGVWKDDKKTKAPPAAVAGPTPTAESEKVESVQESEEENVLYDSDYEYSDDEVETTPAPKADMLSFVDKSIRRSRKTYNREGLAVAQARTIDSIMSLLNVGKGTAAVLLRHVDWDEKHLVETSILPDKMKELAKNAGVYFNQGAEPLEPFTIISDGESKMCNICFSESKEYAHMECKHDFCVSCWKEYVTNGIETGTADGGSVLNLRCPGHDDNGSCPLIVKYEVMESLLEPLYDASARDAVTKKYGVWVGGDIIRRYEQIFVNSFVEDNKSVFWCPNPKGCDHAHPKDSKYETAKCTSCDFVCCLKCSKEAHEPTSCDNAEKWLELLAKRKLAEASAGKKEEARMIKPCPNPACKALTEKVSGCMYLTCNMCHVNWCWMCGDYGGGKTDRPQPHHVFVCNAPPSDEWDGEVVFKDDGRFQFYSERFQNHHDARMFADRKRVEGTEKVKHLLKKFDAMTSNEAQFVNDAYEILIECRQVLAWTYVFTYCIEEDLERSRFQFLQMDLEQRVEDFSKEVEENDVHYLIKNRTEIFNKTTVLAKYLKQTMEV